MIYCASKNFMVWYPTVSKILSITFFCSLSGLRVAFLIQNNLIIQIAGTNACSHYTTGCAQSTKKYGIYSFFFQNFIQICFIESITIIFGNLNGIFRNLYLLNKLEFFRIAGWPPFLGPGDKYKSPEGSTN